MTFADIYNEAVNIRFNNQASKVAQVKKWVNLAEAMLWNAADWIFKYVPPANVSITAGDNTPTLPADFGKVDGALFDYLGEPLQYHDRVEFFRLFQADLVQNVSGEPSDYALVNRQIYLYPVPQTSRTYTLPYRRRYAHLNSVDAVVTGVMSADSDKPLWDVEHHYILVPWSIRIGKILEDDPTALTLDMVLRGDEVLTAFEAMKEELVGGQLGERRQWGGDPALWSSY